MVRNYTTRVELFREINNKVKLSFTSIVLTNANKYKLKTKKKQKQIKINETHEIHL